MEQLIATLLTSLPTGSIAAGLVAILFWLLSTGKLVTRREHDGRVGDLKEQGETLRETVAVKDAQLEHLAAVGETQVKILDSIYALARERGEEQ